MLWRTLVLSSVNVVTCLLVFVPIVEITTPGLEDSLYLHSTSPPYLFLIQLVLGVFAVLIDMLNKRPHLQSKLLVVAVTLSGALATITLWIVSEADHVGCFPSDFEIRAGVLLPLLNFVLFGIVWYDQRWGLTNKKQVKIN